MKNCSKCKENKEIEEFYKKKSTKDGLRSECIECTKKYLLMNKEKIANYKKNYHKSDKYKELSKNKYSKNKEIILKKNKDYSDENKESISDNKKKYYQENKEEILLKRKEYYEKLSNDPELKTIRRKKVRLYSKRYREKNKDILSERIKNRKKNDFLFKITESIRTLIWLSINKRGYKKNSKTYKILGCSFDEFKEYIESQFKDNMCWENYGEWHLDHKIPISWAETEDQIYELNYYSNFQPLWAFDNLSKGNKRSD